MMADDGELDVPRAVGDGSPPGFSEPAFGQRVMARLVDAVVVAPALVAVDLLLDDSSRALAGAALVALYEISMVARSGRTLGKVALDTQVVDGSTGAVPSVLQASVRWSAIVAGPLLGLAAPSLEAVGLVVTLVVLAPAMAPPLHQGLHDRLAGTVVTSTSEDRGPTERR